MEKRWKIKQADEAKKAALCDTLKVHPIICQILVQRGIETFDDAKTFFRPNLDQLHDPFLMDGMQAAVDRIGRAIENGEKIMFYGDYDVDGTTAVSLISLFFKNFYDNTCFYIPDRYSEGYGVSYQGLDWAVEQGVDLIIALDCGVTAVDQVAYAKARNVDFIICDHHLPSDVLPDAIAVLDPKKKSCSYPFKELSGCGVGFKLCQALSIQYKLPSTHYLDLIDLTCASIASDIVPIVDENRVLAYFGLAKFNQNPLPAFKAMMENQKVKKDMSIMDLVFMIGPRINAPGRLAHANAAVELLMCTSFEEARELSANLHDINADRKQIDLLITQEANIQIEEMGNIQSKRTLVLFSKAWHKGVVGIVASRIVEKYYRPTIILAENEDGLLTGSARSIKGFSIYEGIKSCADLLVKFGGHDFAAGLTLHKDHVGDFIERFEEAGRQVITDDMLVPEIEVDAEISLYEISQKFYHILKQMAPFGPANMNPVFCTRNLCDGGYSKKIGENHLKLDLVDEMNNRISALGWGFGAHITDIQAGKLFDICYSIEENEWNGVVSLQLNIKDIKVHA
ncbi:MAG: single-stranded-DNA-specific exonuclease RecJ [Chitinophagales bacterium]|nr:single-stranded-DNA-specific exonuclease RecJ [Chitinophagales bacterium]